MKVSELDIPGVKLLQPRRFSDHRGHFVETYSRRALVLSGIDHEFVQDNQSLSLRRGTVRALHYQLPPAAQAKLVRVLRGRVIDVAVDIRRGSPTFGRYVAAELSADSGLMMFVPVGFAHGFVTLEDNTEVGYKVSDYYSPAHERGLRWSDPTLAIDWTIDAASAILNDRDRQHPLLADAVDLF